MGYSIYKPIYKNDYSCVCVCACICVPAHGSIRQAERQEALLWGAGTAVLIKAQAGDTMGGVPLFIHQPPLPFGRAR